MIDHNRFQLALDLGCENQEERAIQELRALLQEGPTDEEKGWLMLYEARFLGQLLRVAEARTRLAELAGLWEKRPDHDVQIDVASALLYEMQGNLSQTLRELDRIARQYAALLKLPEFRDLYEEIQANRGRLLVDEDRVKEALPLLEETLRFERQKPGDFYYNLGYCYFMSGEWEKSERWLREALSSDLHPAIACVTHYYLGCLYYRKGSYAKAVTAFESAAEYAIQAKRPLNVIYGEMAKAYKRLGLEEESSHYTQLAKSSK